MSNSSANAVKVLFVDDNLQFLEIIERLMGNWSRGEWQVFLAQNAGKALVILQEHPIDLVVVDVQMPVVDGIQFLALLNRKYPAVQKVTLSAYGDDDNARAACISNGAELFLEKPRDPADLEVLFSTLHELARHKPAANGFRGVMRQVNLQDVIQMECLNRNSTILEVNGGKWQGKIFIKEGNIIHAEAGNCNGETALGKILCLSGGEFGMRPFTEPPRQTIDGPWEFLVMEAARMRDEGNMPDPHEETASHEEPKLMARAGVLTHALPEPAALMSKPAPPLRPPSGSRIPSNHFTAPKTVPSAANGASRKQTASRHARIDEMVVCSDKGDVLYEWQSGKAVERVSFLEFLSRKSAQLGEGLNLGEFDRLEIEGSDTRIIARIKKDRGIFMRATKNAAKPAS